MRSLTVLLLVAAVFMPGCITQPGGGDGGIVVPMTVHQTSSIEGSGTIGSVYIGLFAWTYPIKWQGRGTMTLQYPAQPYIVLEGELIWEPVYPEQYPSIVQAISRGEIAVVNPNRVQVPLSPAGTISE